MHGYVFFEKMVRKDLKAYESMLADSVIWHIERTLEYCRQEHDSCINDGIHIQKMKCETLRHRLGGCFDLIHSIRNFNYVEG